MNKLLATFLICTILSSSVSYAAVVVLELTGGYMMFIDEEEGMGMICYALEDQRKT